MVLNLNFRYTIITVSIRMPMLVIREMISSCLSYGSEELLSLTTPGKIRLFAEAFVDICGLIDLMITAPGYILDELILSTPGDNHYLQVIINFHNVFHKGFFNYLFLKINNYSTLEALVF